jgi:hypothetical protein
MACYNCGSNGSSFCAQSNQSFPTGEGCVDWVQSKRQMVQGILPDGSIQDMTPHELYTVYHRHVKSAPQPQRYSSTYKALTSFVICSNSIWLVLTGLFLVNIVVDATCVYRDDCPVEEGY